MSKGESQTRPDDFRSAMRQLAGGVTIITSRNGDAKAGMTATAVTSLSAEPPRLIACVNSAGETYRTIDSSRLMCINVLSDADERHARCFAGMTEDRGEARFAGREWTVGPEGLPQLASALAVLVCDVAMVLNVGTHGIMIADVRRVAAVRPGEPLLYADAGFARLLPRPALSNAA